MIRLDFAALLASPNVRAFLRVIREGETDQTDDAYRTIVGGGRFDDFADHPRVKVYIVRLNVHSTAAGAYQFLARTWDDIKARYGLPDFSPYSQDCGALALINDRKALDDVIDGRLEAAIAKCAATWASLPGDVYGQGGITLQRARAVFLAYGGTEAEAEPVTSTPAAEPASGPSEAVPEETRAMAPALIMGLLGSLMEIFSPVVRAKLTKVLDKQTGDAAISGQVADKVISFAQQAAAQVLPGVVPPPVPSAAPAPAAPSAIDPVVAVGAVKSNAVLAAQVEAQVSDYLEQLAPVLDRLEKLDQAAWAASEASMDAASARSNTVRNDDWMAKALVYGILSVSGLLILFVGGVAVTQITLLQARTPTTEVWAAVTGIIGTVLGILGTVFAYRFGTSRTSAAKDVVIEELANRRRM